VYVDNIQLIYSSNPDDTKNPEVTSITYDTPAAPEEFVNNKTVLDNNTVTFRASYKDADDKYMTGIDASKVSMAIDGVDVVEVQGRDVGAYCGRLWDAVAVSAEDTRSDATPLMHIPQPTLDLAANVATTRPMGDGAWVWDRVKSREDISPLVALTMAHGLETRVPDVPVSKLKPTAYASHGVLTI
jgi:hypothetical protein